MEVAALVALGLLLAYPKSPQEPAQSIDIVPPEFTRRRSTDDLALSPCEVVRQPLQALHNDYFNGFRPYSASVHFRPETERIGQPHYAVNTDNSSQSRQPQTTIEIDESDLFCEATAEVEGHVFAEPTGYLRRKGANQVINSLKAAAEVHLRWLPEQRLRDASTPTVIDDDASLISLTEPPTNVLGHESRSFLQASFSTSGAGVIGVKSAVTLPDTKFSIFGSWPLFVGKAAAPKSKVAKDYNSPPATPLGIASDDELLERTHRAAVHDIEASRALQAREQRAVPFAGASSHGMIDERKIGARYDGDNVLVGGFLEVPANHDKLIPIFTPSSNATDPRTPNPFAPSLLKSVTPFFTELFNAGPNKAESNVKQPTLGGWFGLRNNTVTAVVDSTIDFDREATDLNLSLRYRDQMRQTVAPALVRVDARNAAHVATGEVPRNPGEMSWGEWMLTSNEELNRMEREYIAYSRGDFDPVSNGIQPGDIAAATGKIAKRSTKPENVADMRRTPSFELGLDIRRWGSEALFSFRQRFIVRRKVRNVFEDSNVVGIHNPVDIGVQMGFGSHTPTDAMLSPAGTPTTSPMHDSTPIAPPARIPEGDEEGDPLVKHFTSLSMVGSWQINKNLLVKARIQDTGVAGAIAFKAWSEPTATIVASARKGYLGEPLQLGLRFQSENFGNVEHHAASPSRVTHHTNRYVSTPIHKTQHLKPM